MLSGIAGVPSPVAQCFFDVLLLFTKKAPPDFARGGICTVAGGSCMRLSCLAISIALQQYIAKILIPILQDASAM